MNAKHLYTESTAVIKRNIQSSFPGSWDILGNFFPDFSRLRGNKLEGEVEKNVDFNREKECVISMEYGLKIQGEVNIIVKRKLGALNLFSVLLSRK